MTLVTSDRIKQEFDSLTKNKQVLGAIFFVKEPDGTQAYRRMADACLDDTATMNHIAKYLGESALMAISILEKMEKVVLDN